MPLWWLLGASFALWGQEFFNGFDFLSPMVLPWLQRTRRAPALAASLVVMVVQEGLSSFSLGATLAMAGLWASFLFIARHLDPHNLLFMAGYSAFLAVWMPVAYGMVAVLHDIRVPFPSWDHVVLQWGVFFLIWLMLDIMLFQRERHGAV
ncbi:MAG TPA: hypothetical protein DEU72_04180 [Desulfomicrobiaceae bacterium]|jgi:hypothetical protein|nr:hypothetical protein [Desulfomicrobiaceae bacterium]